MSGVPSQFLAFFDDAATFPPGLAPVDRAVVDHVRRRSSAVAPAVGPAVLGLADLPDARRVAAGLDLSSGPVEVSVVTPAGMLDDALEIRDRVAPELHVAAIELKTHAGRQELADQVRAAAGVEEVPVFLELTAEQVADGALELLTGTGLRLKLRTGGIEAHLFPSPEELGDVIVRAVRIGVAFKLTAGLHEAVRYTDATTGFRHHGFLNIAMATHAARAGEPSGRVVSYLRATDPEALARGVVAADGGWRESFRSFGTCSVTEPADSLRRLGLFPLDD